MAFNIQDEVKLNTILDSANNSGDAGQVLSSTGSNTLLWIDQGDVTIPGSNTEIVFNNSGVLGANNQFVFDKETSRLGIGTNTPTQSIDVVGTVNVSANVHVSGALKANGEFGTDGQILSANSTGGVYWTNPAVTSTSFVELTDTPSAFTGAASRFVKVNSGASALEFVADPGYLTSVSQDTTPQLGGNLDAQNNNITNLGTINTHTIPGGTGTLALTSDLTGGTVTASSGADNRIAVFTATADEIEGDANFTWDGSTLDTGASNAVKAQRFIARTSTYTSITDYALEDNGVIRAGTGLWLVGGATGLTTGIQFGTRPSAANDSSGGWNADVTERMRIQNDGNVGIACTSPTVALDVVGNIRLTGELGSSTARATNLWFSSAIDGGDNATIRLGNDDDLKIYHDGSNSYIRDEGDGILFIDGSTQIQLRGINGDKFFQGNEDGSSKLYQNNVERLTTTPTGVDVTGSLVQISSATEAKLIIEGDTDNDTGEEAALLQFKSDGGAVGHTIGIAQGTVNDLVINSGNGAASHVSTGISLKTKPTSTTTTQQRMNISSVGDIAFYDDTSSSADFFWDASTQSLGIGTTTPEQPLHIDAGSAKSAIRLGETGRNYAYLLRANVSDTVNGGFLIEDAENGNDLYRVNSGASGFHEFYINGNDLEGGSERAHFGSSTIVFNESGDDVDFRVESNNNENMLFVDGGQDRVGIACSSPTVALDIVGATQIANQGGGAVQLKFNTERPWSFLQNGTGASAQLELNSEVDAKYFKITSLDRSSVFEALAHDTDADARIHMVPNGGRVGIGTTAPATTLDIVSSDNLRGIDITVNDTITNQAFSANRIVYNISGSDTFTGSYYHKGFFIDVDSSATGGDTTNEHNIYGLDTNVTVTGDSDRTYGNVAQVIANHTSGTITELRGAYSYARANASLGSTGVVTNATGAFNLGYATHQAGNVASLRGAFNHGQIASSATGTVSAVYGSYNYADVIGGGTTSNAYGSYSRVRVDSGGEVTTGFAVLAQIETTSAADITGSGYLFRGNYPSTSEVTGTAYGLYITNEDRNYFSGDVGIGVTSPSGPFDVRADSDSRTYVGSTGKITTESSAGGAILTLAHTGSTLTDTTAASYIALSHSPSVGGSLTRMGYFGFSSSSGTTWNWVNEINGADTRIYTQDSGGNSISHIRLAETEINFNVDQIDLDFRVESNNNAYALFIRGSDSRVGINQSNPTQALDVAGTITTSANVHITGAIRDSGGSYGTSGQVLSSTGAGSIDWIDAGSGGGGTVTSTNGADNRIAVFTATADEIEGDADFTWDGLNLNVLSQTSYPNIEIESNRDIGTSAANFKFYRSKGGASGPTNLSSGTSLGNIYFYAYTGGSYQLQNYISSQRFSISGGTGADLSFGTLTTEVLTIAKEAKVGINQTSPDYSLDVSETSTTQYPVRLTAPRPVIYFNQDTGPDAYIGINSGATGANTYNLEIISLNNDIIFWPYSVSPEVYTLFCANGAMIDSTYSGGAIKKSKDQLHIFAGGATGPSANATIRLEGDSGNPGYMQVYSGGSHAGLKTSSSFLPLVFSTDNTERMRIQTNGKVVIGATSGTGRLEVNENTNLSESTPHFKINGSGYNGFHWLDGNAYYIGQNSASRSLRLYSSAETSGAQLSAGATSFTTFSDERLKENVEPIENALQSLSGLRTVKYHLKDVDYPDDKKKIGLIAQDLVGVIDEVIDSTFRTGDETEYMGLRYTELIPILVKAIQEQQDSIESLIARITALENA